MTRRRGFVVHAPLLAPHRDDKSVAPLTAVGRADVTAIAGLYGHQPVMHGVQEVRAERYAVGIPFHEYAGTSQPDSARGEPR